MLNIKENIALSQYSVFKIGGGSDYFCEVKDKEELIEALNWVKKNNYPFFILGAGSNVLFSDDGFRGLVIKMNLQELTLDGSDGSQTSIRVGAGVSMARAVNFAMDKGFCGGFEWGIGVPGSIGGSVFGNAGCYGGEMKDVVKSVEVLDTSSEAETRSKFGDACEFSYRHSIFKKHPEWIILGATLKLNTADREQSRAKIIEYTKKRTTSQDIGSKCAGCIFKNFTPTGASGPAISAGYLIDKAGLKGVKVGGAIVSHKHANFIINTGSATASDVKELIGVIKEKVQKVHGILLEEEVRIV